MQKRTCRWCGHSTEKRGKTGLCKECYNEYVGMLAELRHMDIYDKHGARGMYVQNQKDTCTCGKLKMKRAKKCKDCDRERRVVQMKEQSRKNRGMRPIHR